MYSCVVLVDFNWLITWWQYSFLEGLGGGVKVFVVVPVGSDGTVISWGGGLSPIGESTSMGDVVRSLGLVRFVPRLPEEPWSTCRMSPVDETETLDPMDSPECTLAGSIFVGNVMGVTGLESALVPVTTDLTVLSGALPDVSLVWV